MPPVPELMDFGVADVDAGEPDIVAQPADDIHPGHRPKFVCFQSVAFFVQGLAQVGVQSNLYEAVWRIP